MPNYMTGFLMVSCLTNLLFLCQEKKENANLGTMWNQYITDRFCTSPPFIGVLDNARARSAEPARAHPHPSALEKPL